MKFSLRILFCLLLALPGLAQAQTNDGFVRRDGTMYVLRNGQPRPMPRAVHLPNGRTITPDGFVVEPNGQRMELRDGLGCDLTGSPTPTATQAGRTVLQPVANASSAPRTVYVQSAFGSGRWPGWRGKGHGKKRKHKEHDD